MTDGIVIEDRGLDAQLGGERDHLLPVTVTIDADELVICQKP